ncbi:MAG: phosphoribosyltransferase family protein, partial [Actinomycetota bacterium]
MRCDLFGDPGAASLQADDRQTFDTVGALDVSLHRDDIGIRPVSLGAISDIPFDLSGATVVLVDDVLFTGRTVRAAME